jgi:single-strand DNA-binding protein
MAGSVNKAILVGRLGKDPEVRTMQNGNKVVSFSLATEESWRDKASGERKSVTEWHNVTIFNENVGKIAEQYLKKGSQCYIEGQIKTRKWQDKEGNDRYTTEVVLQGFNGSLTLLGDAKGGSRDDDDRDSRSSRGSDDRGSSRGSSRQAALDDDIPF